MATTQTEEALVSIGNPIKLNYKTDPQHRITDKVRNFMTYVDLIPVNWQLNLDPLFQDSSKPAKGGIKYEFELAIKEYKAKCKLYGLPEFSGIRVISTSDTIAQEDISNTYDDNVIGKQINEFTSFTDSARQILLSGGSTTTSNLKQDLKDFRASHPDGMINKGMNTLDKSGGQYAKAAVNLLLSGRQISLPKIWKGTEYTPSLALNVRLISPYGSSKSIQKHVLEPLIYLLLMAAPKTDDGITYGGNTFLKVKAYGISDINLGAITSISIKRGGTDVTYNKFCQPLFVDISITVQGLLPGFACLEEGASIKPTTVDFMQNTSVNDFKPIDADFGFVTVDNVIKSFQKFDNGGSSSRSLLGSFGTIAGIKGMSSTIAGGIASIAGASSTVTAAVAGATGIATQAASVVSTVQNSISSTVNSLTLP